MRSLLTQQRAIFCVKSSKLQREMQNIARSAHLSTEPAVLASDSAVELGDGDKGLQALAAADEPSLIDIQDLCFKNFLIL